MTNNFYSSIRRISVICNLIFALAVSFTAVGQEDSGNTSVSMFTIDAGYASIHDSYLSPITYDGFDLAMGYEAMRPAKRQWLWQLQVGADYNNVENDARNNTLHKLMGDITFDMQRQWRKALAHRVDLSVGPMTQLRAGILYNPVASNNTVTVRAHWNLGVTAMASFDTRMWRLPVTFVIRLNCRWWAFFSHQSMTRVTTRFIWAITATWLTWAGGATAWI